MGLSALCLHDLGSFLHMNSKVSFRSLSCSNNCRNSEIVLFTVSSFSWIIKKFNFYRFVTENKTFSREKKADKIRTENRICRICQLSIKFFMLHTR